MLSSSFDHGRFTATCTGPRRGPVRCGARRRRAREGKGRGEPGGLRPEGRRGERVGRGTGREVGEGGSSRGTQTHPLLVAGRRVLVGRTLLQVDLFLHGGRDKRRSREGAPHRLRMCWRVVQDLRDLPHLLLVRLLCTTPSRPPQLDLALLLRLPRVSELHQRRKHIPLAHRRLPTPPPEKSHQLAAKKQQLAIAKGVDKPALAPNLQPHCPPSQPPPLPPSHPRPYVPPLSSLALLAARSPARAAAAAAAALHEEHRRFKAEGSKLTELHIPTKKHRGFPSVRTHAFTQSTVRLKHPHSQSREASSQRP